MTSRKTAGYVLAMAVCLGCDPDPAKKIRIDTSSAVAPPPAPVRDTMPYTVVGQPVILAPWKHDNCDLVREKPGGRSDLTVDGPCSFYHTADVECRAKDDDMYVAALRKAKGVGTVQIYMNVEGYHGAGSYTDAQLFITFENGTGFYHWTGSDAHVTVLPGEKSIRLNRPAILAAEPPNKGQEILTGTLWCGSSMDESKAVNPFG